MLVPIDVVAFPPTPNVRSRVPEVIWPATLVESNAKNKVHIPISNLLFITPPLLFASCFDIPAMNSDRPERGRFQRNGHHSSRPTGKFHVRSRAPERPRPAVLPSQPSPCIPDKNFRTVRFDG